jgi:alpha-methylacyl-CoA racemase
MEKLGLGPEVLLKLNPRLIYARLTGFGSDSRGIYANRAGHDINYIATSGLLSMMGRKHEKPYAPINFAADFASGGLLCVFGIFIALLERHNSGRGQVVDCAMTDGSAYVASWLFRSRELPIWNSDSRGENILDGCAHFYDTYETKDGKFMAVGALEPQFYAELLKGLNLTDEQVPHFSDFEKNKKVFTEIFKSKSQTEWCEIFDEIDACVTPVVDWKDAPNFEQNKARNVFKDLSTTNKEIIPNPAPKLSRTPGISAYNPNEKMDLTSMAKEILNEIGIDGEEIERLQDEGILLLDERSKL